MLLANNRVELVARAQPQQAALLDVVMLGHYPEYAEAAQAPQWQRLAADAAALDEISRLGLGKACARLQALAAGASTTADDQALTALYNLPIPLHSFGQFQYLFPAGFDERMRYHSELGGRRAWLPLAVQDFFDNAVDGQVLRLWVIRVDERLGARAFLPRNDASLLDPETLGPIERALLIPRAAIVALPDLERLLAPANLPDIPRLRLDNPAPTFLPVGVSLDDGHRERRSRADGEEIPEPNNALAPAELLPALARTLARWRPDVQCLLSVPLAAAPGSEQPGADADFLALASELAGLDQSGALDPTALGRSTDAARHLQLIYPYLRGPDRALSSAAGLIAGMQAAVSQRDGPWRSIAGRPLPGRSLPWPALTPHAAAVLRQAPGVTVLQLRKGRVVVDDERLCAPCLPALALQQLSAQQRSDEHWRSAEIMRFMGWLRRELQALGERLVFDVDARDPRPQLALRDFLTRLHSLGALRGQRPADAYTLTQRSSSGDRLEFDIEIAPAYPVDRIRISFLQDRDSSGAATRIEVAHA